MASPWGREGEKRDRKFRWQDDFRNICKRGQWRDRKLPDEIDRIAEDTRAKRVLSFFELLLILYLLSVAPRLAFGRIR